MNLEQARPKSSGFGLLARDIATSVAFPLAFSQLHLLVNGFITYSIYNCPGAYPPLIRYFIAHLSSCSTSFVLLVYVGDEGDVIDTASRKVVANLGALYNTRKMLEIDWQHGVPIFTTSRQSMGYVTLPGH